MKKKLTSILLLFLAIQTFSQKGFNIQAVLQPQATFLLGSWKTYVPSQNDSSQHTTEKVGTFGLEGGINVGYNFTDKLGVGIGFIYSAQGQNYKDYEGSESGYYAAIGNWKESYTVSRYLELQYLKIPVTFRINSDPEKIVSFNGNVGLYVGFLTQYFEVQKISGSYSETDFNYTYNTTSTSHGNDIDTKYDTKGYIFGTPFSDSGTDKGKFLDQPYNSTDFGVTIGLGFQIRLTSKLFIPITLNEQIGFVDIKNSSSRYKDSAGNTGDTYDKKDENLKVSHRNSVTGLSVGLKICF